MNRLLRCFLCLAFTFTILFGSMGRAFAAPDSYLVEKGDNLIFISENFYGNPLDYKKIYEANSDIINDPDLIFIGQEFKLPKQEGVQEGNTAGKDKAASPGVTSDSGDSSDQEAVSASGDFPNKKGNAEKGDSASKGKPSDNSGTVNREEPEEGDSHLSKSYSFEGEMVSNRENNSDEENNSGGYIPVGQDDYGMLTITVTNSTDTDLARVMIGPRSGITHDDLNVADTPLKPGESRRVSYSIDEEFMEEDWFSIFVYDDKGGNSPSYTFFEKSRISVVNISLSSETGRYVCEVA